MSSNAGDELSSLPAAPAAAFTQEGSTAPAAAFTQEGFTAPADAFTQEGFLGDEAFSSGDRYPKEDEDELLSGDGYARDPDRSVEEEGPLGEEEEDGDDLLLSVKQGAQVEPSRNNSEEHWSSADVQCPECGKLFRNDKSMFGHLRSHPNRGYKKGSGHIKSRPSKGYKPPARPKPLPSRNGKLSPLPIRNGELSPLPSRNGNLSPLPSRNGNLSPPANDSTRVARYSQRDPELSRFEVMMAYVMLTLKQRGDGVAQDQSHKRKHESSELDVPEEDLVRNKAGDGVVLGNKHGTSVVEMLGDAVVHRSEQGSSLVEMAVDDAVLGDKHGTSVAEMPGDDAVHRSEQGSSLVEMAVDDVVLGDKHGTSVAEMPGDDAVYRSEGGSSLAEMAGADMVLPNEHHGSVAVMAEDDVVHRSEQGSSLAEMAGDDVELGDKHGTSVAEMPDDDAVHRSEQGSSLAEMAGDDVVLPNEHHGSVAVMAGDAVVRNEHGSVEVPRKKGRKKSKESTEARRKEKVPSASTVKRSYTCKQCKAEFPTHQALGGHMAAHNKDKRIQAQNEQAAAAWEAQQNQIDRSLNRLVTSSMKPAWEAHQSQKGQNLNRQETKGGGEEPRQGGGMFMSTRELLMERYTKLFNQGWLSRQEAGGSSKRQHTENKDGGSPSIAPPLADGGRRRPFDIDLNAMAPEKE
uniref:C2H2-type domain-containing protein n=1 Tax=Aegilops tauschii TaxID=37682 RepID=R7W6W6_AEGTA